MLPDWGNGNIIGMNSSGSNSVRVENVFVPEYCACSGNWTHNTDLAAPGMYLHDDPLFRGRIYAMYHAGLVIPVIGGAKGALHEFEQIPLTRKAAMQRHFRDAAVYQGHISARHDIVAAEVARMHFGLPDSLF